MNLDKRVRSIFFIFVEGVIVYLISQYLIIGPVFRKFYVGEPAVSLLPFFISYISLGIAVGFTVIALTVYPALKFREDGDVSEQ
ncbi:MAG: hypothetical protein QW302_05180 [Thermoplasmatales archaeon]